MCIKCGYLLTNLVWNVIIQNVCYKTRFTNKCDFSEESVHLFIALNYVVTYRNINVSFVDTLASLEIPVVFNTCQYKPSLPL